MRRPALSATVLVCAGLLVAAGCAGPARPTGPATIVDPGPQPTVTASAGATAGNAPLTGQAVDPSVAARRTVAVPIRLTPGGPAPAGLDQADLVFQEYAENRSLRLVALYQTRDAGKVGPVHEIRPSDVKTLPLFKPFVAYDGGPPTFVDQFVKTALASVSETAMSGYFPGGYADTAVLRSAAPAGGDTLPSMFYYGGTTDPLATSGAIVARQLTITTAGAVQTWTYNPARDAWRTDMGGTPVEVTTVAVLTMPYKTVDVKAPSPHTVSTAGVLGDGPATVVSGHAGATGTWRKPAPKLAWSIVDRTGVPMRPRPGAAWVVYAPAGATVVAS